MTFCYGMHFVFSFSLNIMVFRDLSTFQCVQSSLFFLTAASYFYQFTVHTAAQVNFKNTNLIMSFCCLIFFGNFLISLRIHIKILNMFIRPQTSGLCLALKFHSLPFSPLTAFQPY